MHATAIILGAGAGRRIGGETPKAFLPIAGRALALRTLDRFFSTRCIADAILVFAASELGRGEALLRSDAALRGRPWRLQAGGATRQESARRGLEQLPPETDIVVIHDAARPFASPDLIDRSVEAAVEKGAVVVGLPARDTIKVVSQSRVIQSTLERASLWEIQTPQVFHRELIVAAHERAAREGVGVTDDAMVVERTGAAVYVIDGERTNFKITVPEDVWLAEWLIREGRVG
jgi:2-C-methyl-D-erythritol 4-phosphate cytidylyltransferase